MNKLAIMIIGIELHYIYKIHVTVSHSHVHFASLDAHAIFCHVNEEIGCLQNCHMSFLYITLAYVKM